jgi:hypothetical protein
MLRRRWSATAASALRAWAGRRHMPGRRRVRAAAARLALGRWLGGGRGRPIRRQAGFVRRASCGGPRAAAGRGPRALPDCARCAGRVRGLIAANAQDSVAPPGAAASARRLRVTRGGGWRPAGSAAARRVAPGLALGWSHSGARRGIRQKSCLSLSRR